MYFISKDSYLLENEELEKILIRLDKKGRLVLPLEIREAIEIKTGEKILLSVSAANDGKVIVEIAKAPEDIETQAFSRNGAYVRGKNTKFCPDWNSKNSNQKKRRVSD
jgi:AbrB family looped-hinge helix DNA binding protein